LPAKALCRNVNLQVRKNRKGQHPAGTLDLMPCIAGGWLCNSRYLQTPSLRIIFLATHTERTT
jgi:hypothetical protein